MFATIYLPNFYLQAALRHQPELRLQPVALLDDEEAKAVIIQLNQIAEDTGVSKGMTASQGLARCLNLVVKTRARAQEQLLGEIVLQQAYTLAPYVEATAAGVCTVQFTDDRNLVSKVSRLIERLAESEIFTQAGIAPSPDASFLAAHLAHPVLQVDDAKQFLAPLPIETLAIS
jgi:nucleotidyltransferase/DNA polymerase involved in DNA repair